MTRLFPYGFRFLPHQIYPTNAPAKTFSKNLNFFQSHFNTSFVYPSLAKIRSSICSRYFASAAWSGVGRQLTQKCANLTTDSTNPQTLSISSLVFAATQGITSSILRGNYVSGSRKAREVLQKTPITINFNSDASSFNFILPPSISSSLLLAQLPENSLVEWTATTTTELTGRFVVPVSASQWTEIEKTIKMFVEYSKLPVNISKNGSELQTITPTEKAHIEYSNFKPIQLSPTMTLLIADDSKSSFNADPNEVEEILQKAGSSITIAPPAFEVPRLLPPHRSLTKIVGFMTSFILNYRFYLIFMARTTFQAVRPLLAFCVFGEAMKLALAVMSSGAFIFFFSFVLAFEVLYFFLQCYISYVFLGMFFTAAF